MTAFQGRKVAVGMALETTRGTAATAGYWFPEMSLDFKRKQKKVDDESAFNRVEKTSDSAIVEQSAEGKLEGLLRDQGLGYLLKNIFGSSSSSVHAAETSVYDHTFTVNQSNQPPTHTITRVDGNTDRQHPWGTLKTLEISGAQGDWCKVSGDLLAGFGATSGVASSPSFLSENKFILKHMTAKLAANQAGIAAATAIPVKSFKLTINREVTPFYGAGSNDVQQMYTGSVTVSGEMVLVYDATTYEDLFYGNTKQYLDLNLVNGDVTIGTASHPSVDFKLPKVAVADFGMSNDLDHVIEQTVSFSGEYSLSSSSLISAVLTNLATSY